MSNVVLKIGNLTRFILIIVRVCNCYYYILKFDGIVIVIVVNVTVKTKLQINYESNSHFYDVFFDAFC